MNPKPQYGTPAGDATLAIQQLARQTQADVQELQTLYVLEAFLARLASYEHRDDFVLKGGVLLAAFAVRRSTRDIDLQATRVANNVDEVTDRVRTIAAVELPDGVVFSQDNITASIIRDTDDYTGIRVKLIGMLGRARLSIGVDLSFGDPIVPEPESIELPRLIPLAQPPVVVRGYPLTMVLAEKIVTAVDRGEANTRWRDFADVCTLIRRHTVDADVLLTSLQTVANYRHVELSPLLPSLEIMPERSQPKWRAWRARMRREPDLAEHFADVITEVARFADPVLTRATGGSWDPGTARWAPKHP